MLDRERGQDLPDAASAADPTPNPADAADAADAATDPAPRSVRPRRVCDLHSPGPYVLCRHSFFAPFLQLTHTMCECRVY